MTILLWSAIIVLIVLYFVLYRSKRKRDENLAYMAEKLSEIIENRSAEQLMLVTDDKAIRDLLIEINRLLEENQKTVVQYTRTKNSMKKMLTNISHDLKTPLTVVLGYIETMNNDHTLDDKERVRLLHKVHNKTLEIIDLMNSFFDLAKLESGDKNIPLTRVNMNEICKKNILQFYEMVEANGFEASIQIPDTPIYALGNEEALNRVLNNLLSNALRYGGDGKIIGLTLSCIDHKVVIEVWDRGKGISAKDQLQVFERLYTLEDSRNKAFQGSGLGLTITKRLVEGMGGEISLQSTPYQKTTFTIQLNCITY